MVLQASRPSSGFSGVADAPQSMAKVPSQRYQSMIELLRAFESLRLPDDRETDRLKIEKTSNATMDFD
jgi:hypothetical protein